MSNPNVIAGFITEDPDVFDEAAIDEARAISRADYRNVRAQSAHNMQLDYVGLVPQEIQLFDSLGIKSVGQLADAGADRAITEYARLQRRNEQDARNELRGRLNKFANGMSHGWDLLATDLRNHPQADQLRGVMEQRAAEMEQTLRI